jgi:hypothetical protein
MICMILVPFWSPFSGTQHGCLEGEHHSRRLAFPLLSESGLHRGFVVPLGIEELGDPNCPRCLLPVETAGEDQSAYWLCPKCGLAGL